jgi:DNA mismatch repair protein MutS
MEKDTPLTRQYNQIKQKYPDTVLLFRLGDFFETFNEDAKITSKVCGITLTKRNNGAAGEMPLAGFPQHQLDNYLPKLVRAGYRVAVCEQLEDPKKAKGLVKRDVVEVVTPGVTLYDKILDHKLNNYICSVYLKQKGLFYNVGLSFADISTGEYSVSEFPLNKLSDVLESVHPAEIIISKSQKNEINSYLDKLSF